MKVWEKLKAFRQSRKKYIITLILLVTLVALMIYGKDTGERRMKLVYSQALDEVAVTVNGTDLTLRDVAFYVAFEEEQVEEQACEYNPEDTSEYWNVHVDGIYIRVAARNAAIQMAIHDELFYQMAMEEKIRLRKSPPASLHTRIFGLTLRRTARQRGLALRRRISGIVCIGWRWHKSISRFMRSFRMWSMSNAIMGKRFMRPC